MLAILRTNCPDCGTIDVFAQAISVLITNRQHASYGFACPECERVVTYDCPVPDARHLAGIGVEVIFADGTPAEAQERRPDGPPLALDDLLDFHQLLDGGDTFAEWTTTTGGN